MKQEDRLLLLKDLTARLLYGVQLRIDGDEYPKLFRVESDCINCYPIDKFEIKPYLRLLSSMTEEEAKEICILYGLKDILSIKITDKYIDVVVDDGVCSTEIRTIWYDEIISSIEIFDYLNVNHFDYRGLIPKGLALEAPEGMYN